MGIDYGERRMRFARRRELRRLIDRSSLGTELVKEVILEGRRRAEGRPTMTDAQYLELVDRSLA